MSKLTVILLGFVVICSVTAVKFPSLQHLKPKASSGEQTNAVKQLLTRVLGTRAAEFQVTVDSSLGPEDKDTFVLKSNNNNVEITGTTGIAVSMGLYYYLSNYCGCMITWGGEQLNIPSPLPKLPASGITVSTNDKFRYYQNVCTVSYSFAWYKWEDWEKQLDWMALHGINLPLAFNGQEAIFQRVYSRLGFTMKDLESHFGGPAFLAWSRMGNMHGWGGPINQNWIDDQLTLQHSILKRMRSLGMIPVLPGFAGHVPDAMRFIYPKANISRLGDWAGFNASFCCTYLLDFNDQLFKKIGVAFIKEMEFEFGVDHIYNVDSFNEMSPRSGASEYLSLASRIVYETLKEADSQAIWLMQGWLFLSGFWTPTRIKAYLTGVPQGQMIILDLYSEVVPIFTRTESYYGQPFIWCMLHDFGGTMEMYGALININNGPFDGRRFPNSTMIGIGITPEGIYQNEVVYEFFLENSWRTEPRNISNWISNYVRRRYGHTNAYLDLAWQYLKLGVYNNTDYHHDNNLDIIPTVRPRLTPLIKQDVWYNPEDLFVAWDIMTLSSSDFKNSSLFMYDLVDVTRNSLQIISMTYYTQFVLAFSKNNTAAMKSNGDALIGLLKDMETVLASDSHFLLGKWINSAKSLAKDNINDRFLYEFNARNQVTLWGPRGEIRDYACKQWSGLLADYYIPRWELFINYSMDCLAENKTYNTNELNEAIYNKVEVPFSYQLKLYPSEPTGDTVQIVNALNKKYRPDSRSEFFQSLQKESSIRRQQDTRTWFERIYGSRIVI